MTYRPQFALAKAAGCDDLDIVYVFDSTNVPALAALTLAVGEQSGYITLPFDQDADFYLCAIKVNGTTYAIQFQDPFYNPLSDDFVFPELAYGEVMASALEPLPLYCPAGSVMQVRLKNLG